MHLASLSVHLTACSYLMLEFPSLAVTDPPQHIAEIGCGCGSGEQRGLSGWVMARGRSCARCIPATGRTAALVASELAKPPKRPLLPSNLPCRSAAPRAESQPHLPGDGL